MRYLDEVLIVPFPHTDSLLPEQIFPHNDCTHSLLDQEVDDGLTGSMEIVVHLPIPFGGDALHLPCDTVSFPFGQAQLQFFHALIIPLIDGLERSTVNQSREKPCTVCSYRR